MNATRTLSAVLLVGLCNFATAQVEQIERRVYARLETMRHELLSACLDADPAVLALVAKDLLADDGRSPQELTVTAMLRLRGAAMGDEPRFRAHLVPIVQPVVVDQGIYDGVHVTPYLARLQEDPAPVVFECLVRDAKGDVVSSICIAEKTSTEDLLRFRATGKVPLKSVPEGRYRIEVRCLIAMQDAHPTIHPFHYDVEVIKNFKQRADRFPFPANPRAVDAWERQRVVEAWYRDHEKALADPLRRAIFFGAAAQVQRVYAGEPRLPRSDPRRDLEVAERILHNLDADDNEDLLDGVTGRVVIGLPVGKGRGDGTEGTFSLVSLDLSAWREARPLVLFVPGAPTWNHRVQRPASPRFIPPNWMLDALRRVSFDVKGRFHLAVMESPGRFRSAPDAIRAVCRELGKILRVKPGAVVLVGEREGAYAVSRAVLADDELAAGCVVVCGGAMPRVELERLKRTRLLAVTGSGHSTTTVLRYMVKHAAELKRPDLVTLDDDGTRPWLFALPLASKSIENFALMVTGLK